ncbi:acyl carrier protein [Legionella antarctica]|uniref:Acyl carrier protein n=1 Tax=Legionella antarctica TaxID=2708020 RepID=A0A6F8T868_9GAMM|nr:phosphopantetheine-binding protein [Legionella antarctica]BCA96659.1 acyl carrier protein [Legionella antarctica]
MNREEIFSVIKQNIHSVIDGAEGKEITEEDSMNDFGADSLEIVEVVSRSMRKLEIKIPRTELGKAKNLGDLVSLFEEHAQKDS